MSESKKQIRALRETLTALDESLDKLVLVGGWLPFIYCNYLWKVPALDIPYTTDIDLGVQETGPLRYALTVFQRLRQADLAMEPIYSKEKMPIQFIYKKSGLEVRIDFITSHDTSDDTHNRFLGTEVSWNRIDSFEVLLHSPKRLRIDLDGIVFSVNVPLPATFFFHKGIIFASRSDDYKKAKDLYTVFWGLKFCPDRQELIKEIMEFRKHEYFRAFQQNLKEYVKDISKPGYLLLRPFLSPWLLEKKINSEITEVFHSILEITR